MKVLFPCTENSCRGRMAEGRARDLVGDAMEIGSAGIEKLGMNPNAVAVTLFGPGSPAALATVVGVPVEFPVMPSVCRPGNESRRRYTSDLPLS